MSFCSALSHLSKAPYLKCTALELRAQSQPCLDSKVESVYHYQIGLSKSKLRCPLKLCQKVIGPTLSNLCSTFPPVFDNSVLDTNDVECIHYLGLNSPKPH